MRATPAESEEDANIHNQESKSGGSKDVAATDRSGDTASAEKSAGSTSGTSGSGPNGGRGNGTSKTAEVASYGRMLHDRLYSAWSQPTTSVSSSAKISTVVRLRIEKDGQISDFEIIRPSGNVAVDESVAAIGKRVSHVDPLPAALRGSGHYDVKINFELNSGE